MISKKRALEAVRNLRKAAHDATAVFSDSFWDDIDTLCDFVDGKTAADLDLEQKFHIFYDCYPRKVAPDSAKKALRKRIAEGGDKLFAKIMDALMRHKAEWQREGQETKFIPHPATWLNQGRFLDAMPSAEIANKRQREDKRLML